MNILKIALISSGISATAFGANYEISLEDRVVNFINTLDPLLSGEEEANDFYCHGNHCQFTVKRQNEKLGAFLFNETVNPLNLAKKIDLTVVNYLSLKTQKEYEVCLPSNECKFFTNETGANYAFTNGKFQTRDKRGTTGASHWLLGSLVGPQWFGGIVLAPIWSAVVTEIR